MRTLGFFNPSHDEALAAGGKDYTPPLRVQHMERDLASLASIWGDGETGFVDFTAPKPSDDFVVSPWGWDTLAVKRLCKWGVKRNLLPTEQTLLKIRQLSSRETGVEVLSNIRQLLRQDIFGGEAMFVHDIYSLNQALEQWQHVVVKAPWSCSGRGIIRLNLQDAKWKEQAKNILKRQGGLDVEPFYQRVLDFAMEFFSDGHGNISFSGLSLFQSKGMWGYGGNIVASDDIIADILSRHCVDCDMLRELRECLTVVLRKHYAGQYCGYIGIDMMVCRGDKDIFVHPCVEVNLRRTMGQLAIELRTRLARGSVGTLAIATAKGNGEMLSFKHSMENSHKLSLEQNLVSTGYFPLTPVNSSTQFHAYLLAQRS